MRELRLYVRDFAGTDRWSWELTGPGVRARHDVRLDVSRPEYEAFLDLAGFVRRHAPPDRRVAREREIVREVGAWIGAEVLGPLGPLLLAAAPAVVRVVVPADVPAARRLLFVPLELAHVRGRPLAVQDVTPVMQVGPEATAAKEPARRPVRVLALFSLPQGSRALNLRRERTALTGLFTEAARSGRAVELRALQYGVSRERLRAVLAEPAGWDIVHVSGHGTPGELLLETDTGRPDRVTAADLAGLLATACRVGLVTLSACWSAALTVREQRRALGMPTASGEAAGGDSGGAPDVGVVAGELVARLGCAVLAMRYPVADGFAVALAEGLYRRLVVEGLPLPRALAGALTETAAQDGPALSAATPALFGARAATLRLAPAGHPAGPPAAARTSGVPPLPDRFVGRVALMARLSALLAPGSGACGAVLQGMPGAGKTACARELVETHAHAFEAVVWFKVPEHRETAPDARSVMTEFAAGLEGAGFGEAGPREAGFGEAVLGRAGPGDAGPWQAGTGETGLGQAGPGQPGPKDAEPKEAGLGETGLPDPGPGQADPRDARLTEAGPGDAGPRQPGPRDAPLGQAGPGQAARFLDGGEEFVAALVAWLARRRVLLVIDHVDALLGPDGAWRDPRWARLTEALSGHAGAGRTLLTCRVRPPGAGTRLPTAPVDLLTPDEALLLARELPHLAALAEGRAAGLAPDAARRYATALLEVTRGHPRLLELADAQAADPDRLAALLGSAGRARSEGGRLPDGFFNDGPPQGGADPDGTDHLRLLSAWTDTITDSLTPAHADLFRFLCCLEEPDRVDACVEHNWPDLRARLGHPAEPPATGLATLAERGLITPRPASSYDIQAAVAEQGRAGAGTELRRLVDERMAGYWARIFEMAWRREGTDAEGASAAGPVLARAGLSAAPYLIRIGLAQGAEALLQAVLRRDGSRSTLARVMPVLRRIAVLAASGDGTAPPTDALAEVLWATDPATAERMARTALARASERGDAAGVSAAAGRLVGLCVRTGRLQEALDLADTEIGHARAAGLGGWAGLVGEVHRLHVLAEQGRAAQVLAEAAVLRRRMDALPRDSESRSADGTVWWQVWEEFCDTGQRAAIEAAQWASALEFNAELCAVKVSRGAPGVDVAQARFPAYLPLLRLGRLLDALSVLEGCREAFEAADDPLHLGEVFGALATVEDARGRGALALARGRDCLRYAYRGGYPAAIAVSHANYGSYLHAHTRDAAAAVAHHLAGALLGLLTGGRTVDALGAVVDDVLVLGAAALPADPAELCARVAQVPGVALDRLLERLSPDTGRVRALLEAAVQEVRREVGAEAGTGTGAGREAGGRGARRRSEEAVARAVWALAWEPVLGALVAAQRGNTAARVKVRQQLERYAGTDPGFRPLAGALGRILAGERDPGVASAGLGPFDAPVAARALAALRGEAVDVAPELWPVMHLGLALGNLLAAATSYGPTAEVTRGVLDGFRADPDLASALEEVLAGARDPALAARPALPAHRALVAAVLRCVGEIDRG